MKRFVAFAILALAAPAAMAQLYKWVDKDGRVHYSDQPPPSQESKQIAVPTAPSAPAPKSAVAKEKDLERVRAEEKEKEKVAADKERKAAIDAENCKNARNYLRTVTSGGRIATYNDKGEPELLDDKQIEIEKAKAQKAVDEACKSS
jgi:outer membrane biosynthesis protein TonB